MIPAGLTIAPLWQKEKAILEVLVSAQGDAVSFDDIVAGAWSPEIVQAGGCGSLTVHICTLRKKLATHARIDTVRGVGYRLVVSG